MCIYLCVCTKNLATNCKDERKINHAKTWRLYIALLQFLFLPFLIITHFFPHPLHYGQGLGKTLYQMLQLLQPGQDFKISSFNLAPSMCGVQCSQMNPLGLDLNTIIWLGISPITCPALPPTIPSKILGRTLALL